MEGEKLVSAKEICDRHHLPRHILYGLVDRKEVPAHEQPREFYHKRRRLLFRPSEVDAALKRLKESSPDYGPERSAGPSPHP